MPLPKHRQLQIILRVTTRFQRRGPIGLGRESSGGTVTWTKLDKPPVMPKFTMMAYVSKIDSEVLEDVEIIDVPLPNIHPSKEAVTPQMFHIHSDAE